MSSFKRYNKVMLLCFVHFKVLVIDVVQTRDDYYLYIVYKTYEHTRQLVPNYLNHTGNLAWVDLKTRNEIEQVILEQLNFTVLKILTVLE